MAITIRKTGAAYEAVVTPPHAKAQWQTQAPVGASPLARELQRLGCHQTDIGDAFYAADPNWLQSVKNEQGQF